MSLAAKSRQGHGGHSDRPPVFPSALIEGHRSSVSHNGNEPTIASLQSRVPARRKAAAEILGEEHKMTSFAPLVRALQRENVEEVQFSILTALRNIGGHFFKSLLQLPELLDIDHHRIHHMNAAVLRRPGQGSGLIPEKLRMSQKKTASPQAQRGILFLFKLKKIRRLVPAQIKHPEINRLTFHSF